jgi:hypothetical protein
MRQSGKGTPDATLPHASEPAGSASGPLKARARSRQGPDSSPGQHWIFEPKTAIWIGLGAALVIGGGRKLLATWRSRRAVARLSLPRLTTEDIEVVADHGRSGVWELLRIFSEPSTPAELQAAAGRALARLWRSDELVAEEEQAIVRRGFTVKWRARKRYPRALTSEIPVSVAYQVPFLEHGGRSVGPENLEWSHRVVGARRAALEEFSDWKPGRGEVAFTIVPGDFESNGPHRLVLQTRVRTAGLSSRWEIEPPHIPFSFEFDPLLRIESMLSLPDQDRGEQIARAVRVEPDPPANGEPSRYLVLGTEWALRDPPYLAVSTPLPCDLSHAISIELEGVPGPLPAGKIVLGAQGLKIGDPAAEKPRVARFEVGSIRSLPDDAIPRPGVRRLKLVLEADPSAGWADPDVRSIWPGRIETDWTEVEIVRR